MSYKVTYTMNEEEQRLYDSLKSDKMKYLAIDHKAGQVVFIMKDGSYVIINSTIDEDVFIDYQ